LTLPQDYKIIFFDFEVFKFDWMVVLIDYKTKKKKIIVNDVEKLRKFYEKNIDSIWVGYNSRNYDQYILKGLLCGMDAYVVSNSLILEDKKGNQVVTKANEYPLNNFDIATGFHSLKQLEGFMGSKIKESDVSFDIDRKLTHDEIVEVLKYCNHDVEETMKVFEYRKEEFNSQLSLIKAFDLPMEMFTKTKAQLSATILGTNKTDWDDEFDLIFPDTLKIEKYTEVFDWYKDVNNRNYKKKLYVDIAGVPTIFAWGGIHGALTNCHEEGIILCMDVALTQWGN
jgi:hypothetical protein